MLPVPSTARGSLLTQDWRDGAQREQNGAAGRGPSRGQGLTEPGSRPLPHTVC